MVLDRTSGSEEEEDGRTCPQFVADKGEEGRQG